MEFGILGPLEARSGGEPVDLGPYKQRALLALLLLHVDRVVPTDRILEETGATTGRARRRRCGCTSPVCAQRARAQRGARGQSSVLVTRDHGYWIQSDPATLDANRFENAVRDARARLTEDPDGAAQILRDALDLWRGTALQDFTYEEFAQAEIARLEELRLGAGRRHRGRSGAG